VSDDAGFGDDRLATKAAARGRPARKSANATIRSFGALPALPSLGTTAELPNESRADRYAGQMRSSRKPRFLRAREVRVECDDRRRVRPRPVDPYSPAPPGHVCHAGQHLEAGGLTVYQVVAARRAGPHGLSLDRAAWLLGASPAVW
jgi:hypothetical protein